MCHALRILDEVSDFFFQLKQKKPVLWRAHCIQELLIRFFRKSMERFSSLEIFRIGHYKVVGHRVRWNGSIWKAMHGSWHYPTDLLRAPLSERLSKSSSASF